MYAVFVNSNVALSIPIIFLKFVAYSMTVIKVILQYEVLTAVTMESSVMGILCCVVRRMSTDMFQRNMFLLSE